MEAAEDEISSQVREERDRVSTRYAKYYLILGAFYAGARIAHWLFDFPSSVSPINAAAAGVGGAILLFFVENLAATLVLESRLRSQNIGQKLALLEARLTSLGVITPIAETKKSDQKQEDPEGNEERLASYRASAERGERWGQHNLGITYYNNKDNEQAAFWFRKAAEHDDEEAQFFLAEILSEGEGISPDYAEGLRWYHAVIERNSTYCAHAEYAVAEMYATGRGVSRNFHEAVKYWKRAAEHGFELASSRLGDLYQKGADGIQHSFEESYFWFYVAVAAEDPKEVSQYRIDDRDEMAKRLDPESIRKVQDRARLWLAGKWSEAYTD